MKSPAIGRNDPCPCGSGKKFKECCQKSLESVLSNHGASAASADLPLPRERIQFASQTEDRSSIERHAQQHNQEPLNEFHGLSPEQMYRMLYFPFASPEFIRFPDVLDTSPTTPIMSLVEQLIDAIGEQGLRPTANGNLPQKFCRKAALAYWGEDVYRENTRYGGINREEDFSDLHITRLVAELAGLVRKYKRKFILSRKCRALMTQQCSAALHRRMFRAYTEQFNWAYWDRYPDLRFIQTAFLFTLYLLTRYGDTWRSHKFYEDNFLRAFPALLDEIPPDQIFTPEEQLRSCFTSRTLMRFVGFFGLAAVEPVSDTRLRHEYRVKGLPLLHETVQFHLSG